jgi:DNA-binding NarL/FixJ family response regulator
MRILLAEHHTKVRRGLRMLIKEKTSHTLVGEAVDWEGLIEQIGETHPDIVLLDWEIPGLKGGDLKEELRAMDCCPSLIVLSNHIKVKEEVLNADVDLFVSKNDPPKVLVKALEIARNVVDMQQKEDST